MKSRILCMMAFLALVAVGVVQGSNITIDSYAWAGTDTSNLTSIGSLDWVLPYIDQKSGGTAIRTYSTVDGLALQAASLLSNPPSKYAYFSYTDGEAGGTTGVFGKENYAMTTMSSIIDLPIGSGTITAWLYTWGSATNGTFSAEFADGFNVTRVTDNADVTGISKVVLSYSTTTAQALTVAAGNSGGGASMYGVAVSMVPEPSCAVLLAAGLFGLLGSARRKQR